MWSSSTKQTHIYFLSFIPKPIPITAIYLPQPSRLLLFTSFKNIIFSLVLIELSWTRYMLMNTLVCRRKPTPRMTLWKISTTPFNLYLSTSYLCWSYQPLKIIKPEILFVQNIRLLSLVISIQTNRPMHTAFL